MREVKWCLVLLPWMHCLTSALPWVRSDDVGLALCGDSPLPWPSTGIPPHERPGNLPCLLISLKLTHDTRSTLESCTALCYLPWRTHQYTDCDETDKPLATGSLSLRYDISTPHQTIPTNLYRSARIFEVVQKRLDLSASFSFRTLHQTIVSLIGPIGKLHRTSFSCARASRIQPVLWMSRGPAFCMGSSHCFHLLQSRGDLHTTRLLSTRCSDQISRNYGRSIRRR